MVFFSLFLPTFLAAASLKASDSLCFLSFTSASSSPPASPSSLMAETERARVMFDPSKLISFSLFPPFFSPSFFSKSSSSSASSSSSY